MNCLEKGKNACYDRNITNRHKLVGGYVMKVTLERYHGLGNDYVVFDPNKNELELKADDLRP